MSSEWTLEKYYNMSSEWALEKGTKSKKGRQAQGENNLKKMYLCITTLRVAADLQDS